MVAKVSLVTIIESNLHAEVFSLSLSLCSVLTLNYLLLCIQLGFDGYLQKRGVSH